MKRKRSSRTAAAVRNYWLFSLSGAIVLAILIWAVISIDILVAWLVSINLTTLIAFWYDKSIAGTGNIRVPERLLLTLSYIGGSLGAIIAMNIFRHKTAKLTFKARFWLVVILQVLLIVAYFLLIKPAIGSVVSSSLMS